MKIKNLNKYIDHTLLAQDANVNQISAICKEAIKYNFASVCVNPDYIKFCKQELLLTNIKVCTVIGFPLGANQIETKIFEAKQAIKNGADELDLVINISAIKNNNFDLCAEEVSSIREISKNKILKVIIETCLLTNDEIKVITALIAKNNADFVKTSTGFSRSGAKINDVLLIKETLDQINSKCLIKASGGIKTLNDTINMIQAGASRIGTSSGVLIINENMLSIK